MTRIAAIDCGTNSIRLLVAEPETAVDRAQDAVPGAAPDTPSATRLKDLTRQMRIVRLGQGVDRTGVLDPAAIGRTLAAAREYREIIDSFGGVDRLRFVATSAVRDASNREEFIGGIREILGCEPEVIPGEEEASLSFSGAASGVPAGLPRPLLVVDIGGGSTELVLGDGDVQQSISIDMGSVRVTEKFLADCDPAAGIPPQSEAAASAWIDEQLDAARTQVDLSQVGTLVGVAGTVTTVTAQALGLPDYQPDRIHGAVLSLEEIGEAVRFMVDQPIAVKKALGFMPAGREDVIAAGALIWSRIISRVCSETATRGHIIDRVVTSEHDILDGIALSIL